MYKFLIPEIFFSFTILIQLIFNIKNIKDYKLNFSIIDKEVFGQIVFILFCVLIIFFNLKLELVYYNFIFNSNLNDYVIKILFLVFCLISSITIWRSFLVQNINFIEFFTVLFISILALLLLLNTLDFIFIYLIIELQALCFYILSCFVRNSSFSTEAGLKYFISGAFISGFFLFGCSLIYISLGTLNLNLIALLLSYTFSENLSFIVLIGILFITITFLFKISAAPFHFWSPDVYEGSGLSSTIIFSIIPKLALITFLIKWFVSLSFFFPLINYILILSGLSSVFVGTFFAIKQKRVKRIIIYSTIAQVGFLLLGISTNTIEGFSSVYFFLLIYLVTSVALWNFITLLHTFQKKINRFTFEPNTSIHLSNVTTFFETSPLWSFLLIFIFYSLAGIPPFIGFFSKLFILYSLIEVKSFYAVIVLIAISIVSVFYYIRFIKLLFFEKKTLLLSNIKYQTVFSSYLIELDFLLIIIPLFLLLYIFFYPSILFLLAKSIVLNNLSI